jgi:hypothetical protein
MITIAINIVVVVLGYYISSWCGIYMDADWTGERS